MMTALMGYFFRPDGLKSFFQNNTQCLQLTFWLFFKHRRLMETDSQVYDWVSADEWEKHCHSNSALAQYSWSSGLGSGNMLD